MPVRSSPVVVPRAGSTTSCEPLGRALESGVQDLDARALFASGGVGQVGVLASVGDANATARLVGASLEFGAGGGTAPDCLLRRKQADTFSLGDGDSLRVVGGVLSLAQSGDDDGVGARLRSDGGVAGGELAFGAGLGAAVDWVLRRRAANTAILDAGDSLFVVGVASLGRRAGDNDANPTIALTATGFELGAGGGTATDWHLARQAADAAVLGSGDRLDAVAAGALGVRVLAADAQPALDLSTNGLRAGAGGAAALDVGVARDAAARLKVTDGGAGLGAVRVASAGVYLNGTAATDVLLKRVVTTLQARLGDDSGYADVALGAVTTGAWQGTAVAATFGGTAQTTWATGDLLYASGANALAKLAVGGEGQQLQVVGGVPAWAAAVPTTTPQWTKVSKTRADWQPNAGTSGSITLYTLPAGGVVHAVKIKHATAFAGAGITVVTLEVGLAGSTAKYATAFDVLAAVAATNFYLASVVGSEDHGSTTALTGTLRTTGGAIDALTAGAVDVWLLVSTAV